MAQVAQACKTSAHLAIALGVLLYISLHLQKHAVITATGQSVKEVPVQKTVPVIGTPADGGAEQHEVLTLLLKAKACPLPCIVSPGHEPCGDAVVQ